MRPKKVQALKRKAEILYTINLKTATHQHTISKVKIQATKQKKIYTT